MLESTWNFEAETAFLGMTLIENSHVARVPELRPEHFYEGAHQRIYEAILEKVAAGEPASPISLGARFERDEALAGIGGKYLFKLVTGHYLFARVEDLAEEIISQHRRRRFMEACRLAVGNAENCPSMTYEELSAELHGRLQEIGGDDSRKVRTNYEVTESIIHDLKTRLPAVSTGLSRLDSAMGGGLYPGRSYGFAARKKVGKTTLASTISYNLNEAGVKHLFIAGEMGAKEIHERNLARAIQAFPSEFRGERRGDRDFLRKIADHSRATKRAMLYQDAPGLTFDELRRSVASAVARHKITGFILDYWQLVGGKSKSKSTTEHLDEVAQWIADFCRQHKLWSITMAQINQDGNTRGGEGIRLAFDQVYQLKGMGEREDITLGGRWIEMMDTRYTKWGDIGSAIEPGLQMVERGPYFEQVR